VRESPRTLHPTPIEAPESLPVSQSQRDELDRRLKLHREDPEAASPWEVVRARLLGRE
jgi:putative addiction module component (TIGR02574 family)